MIDFFGNDGSLRGRSSRDRAIHGINLYTFHLFVRAFYLRLRFVLFKVHWVDIELEVRQQVHLLVHIGNGIYERCTALRVVELCSTSVVASIGELPGEHSSYPAVYLTSLNLLLNHELERVGVFEPGSRRFVFLNDWQLVDK